MQVDWTLVIAAVSLELVIISSAVGVVWRLARSEAAIRSEFTEKLSVMSGKLYQVEIWSRDEFVRKGSFENVINRMEKGFSDLRTEISGRLDSMSSKIDNIRHPG